MITKERLEELIKQGAIVYYIEYNGDIEKLDLKISGVKGCFGLIPLFETKEDAEWHKEFGYIERTEILELPTWEELFKQERVLDCYTQEFAIVENKCVIGIALFGVDFTCKIIEVSIGSDKLFVEELTKENYTLACRKAKELFLGD